MLRLAFASLLALASGASLAQSAPYPDGPRIPSLPESAFERIDRALRDRVATAVDADALFVRGLQATMDPGARIADYAVPETWTVGTEPLPRNLNGKIMQRLLRQGLSPALT